MKKNLEKAFLVLPLSFSSLINPQIEPNNKGIEAYRQGNYQQAQGLLETAQTEYCLDLSSEYCDQINYNLANTYYRLGENESDKNKQNELWQQAIDTYQKDLRLNPEDKEAQENIEFIKQKMAENQKQQEQEEKNQESDQNNQDNEKQEGEGSGDSEGENNESEGESESTGENQDQGEVQGDSSKNQDSNQSESESEGNQEDQSNNPVNQPPSSRLSPGLEQQLEEYMEALEQQEANNRQYFNQNPDAQKNQDPFGSFFNDPLINSFFGNDPFFNNIFDRQFSDLEDSNTIDW